MVASLGKGGVKSEVVFSERKETAFLANGMLCIWNLSREQGTARTEEVFRVQVFGGEDVLEGFDKAV